MNTTQKLKTHNTDLQTDSPAILAKTLESIRDCLSIETRSLERKERRIDAKLNSICRAGRNSFRLQRNVDERLLGELLIAAVNQREYIADLQTDESTIVGLLNRNKNNE